MLAEEEHENQTCSKSKLVGNFNGSEILAQVKNMKKWIDLFSRLAKSMLSAQRKNQRFQKSQGQKPAIKPTDDVENRNNKHLLARISITVVNEDNAIVEK